MLIQPNTSNVTFSPVIRPATTAAAPAEGAKTETFVPSTEQSAPSMTSKAVKFVEKPILALGGGVLGLALGGLKACGAAAIGAGSPVLGLAAGAYLLADGSVKHDKYMWMTMAAASVDALVQDPLVSLIAKSVQTGASYACMFENTARGAEAGWNLVG